MLKPTPSPSATPVPDDLSTYLHELLHRPWFWPVLLVIFLTLLAVTGVPPFHRRGTWRDWP